MNAAEHLEMFLGLMNGGWSSRSLPGIQICLFPDQPVSGINTLATLGLSNTILVMEDKRSVRQELLLAVPDDRQPEEFAKLLLTVAEQLETNKKALMRGEVIHLGEQIAMDSHANALYSSMPVLFPAGIATLADSAPPTVIVWLIPLLPSEVSFIESSGWSEFEDRLEAVDPDLFNLCRESII